MTFTRCFCILCQPLYLRFSYCSYPVQPSLPSPHSVALPSNPKLRDDVLIRGSLHVTCRIASLLCHYQPMMGWVTESYKRCLPKGILFNGERWRNLLLRPILLRLQKVGGLIILLAKQQTHVSDTGHVLLYHSNTKADNLPSLNVYIICHNVNIRGKTTDSYKIQAN